MKAPIRWSRRARTIYGTYLATLSIATFYLLEWWVSKP